MHATRTALPATKRRVPMWDNARWVAIALVVVGHGILPLISVSDAAYSVYLFIYSFHVAVFVTVSGYFAKSGPLTGRTMRGLLTDIVFPYVIFETIWTVVKWLVTGHFSYDLATPSWTLWFLIALAVWRVALPFLVLLRYPLLISIALSIAAGYSEAVDSTLSLTRIFGMLPFFVFGWSIRQQQLTGRWLALPTRVAWRWRAGAIALFAAVLAVMPLGIDLWRDLKLRRFLLYDEGFDDLGFDEPWSGLVRLVLLLVAMVLALGFLTLMPRVTTPFTRFGSATMYVYLLHPFFLYPFRESGILEGPQPRWVLPAMVLGCLLLAVVLSTTTVRRLFRPLVEPKWPWAFRPTPETPTGTIVLPVDPPPAPPRRD
ncbi:acyltransferase family protein [Agromyces seonyuensis]|uniref:Acyltransferase family protein n=1 Tax=Agromyces seonyuensis TaxID=2662446 RepID=A0A6I4NX08_9MICO|nr:acyltransferase family protein [Agromyces seonyuensis]MWB98823.1 acyltransferase family protein [Agromyces seonyuensis]